MRVSFHQLHVFRTVADQVTVTAAANKLHMTQPAVSNILKSLENYYDCKLFEYIGKQRHLTESGKILYETALQIEKTLSKSWSDIRERNGELAGSLSIAAASTAKYFIPRLLAAFKQQYPTINVQLKVCNREEVIKRLQDNRDDFVVMSQPPEGLPIERHDFYEDQLVVAAAFDNRHTTKPLTLSQLADADWLIRETGSGTRIVMQKLFKEYKIRPNIAMEVGNNESIKQLIIAGMGISIVSQQSIELEIDAELIKVLPVKGFPLQHEWYLVNHKNKHHSMAANTFKSFVDSNANLAHYSSWHASLHRT